MKKQVTVEPNKLSSTKKQVTVEPNKLSSTKKQVTVYDVDAFAPLTSSEISKIIRKHQNYWIVGETVGVDRKIVKIV